MDSRKFLSAARVRDPAGRTCTRRELNSAAAFGRPGGGRESVSATRYRDSRSGSAVASVAAQSAHRHPWAAVVDASRAEPQAARANPNTRGVHVRAEGSRTRRTSLACNAKRVVAVALLALRVPH